jgi:hypothetical protein
MLSAAACSRRRRAIKAFECWQRTDLTQNGNPLRRLTPPVSNPKPRPSAPDPAGHVTAAALDMNDRRSKAIERWASQPALTEPTTGFTRPV